MNALHSDELRSMHAELLHRLDLRRTDVNGMSDEDLWHLAQRHLRDILDQRRADSPAERAALEKTLLQEVVGLGVLEDLLHDDSISEIMVNGAQAIFVERTGKLSRTDLRFSSTG